MTIIFADNNPMIIRLANVEDSQEITALCQQLGYPTSQAALEQRLLQIQQDERHAVYLAQSLDKQLAGWIHVYICYLLQTDLQAVIGGLVVNESDRRSGTGRSLMQSAEQWAFTRGCKTMLVRSNIVRKNAHNFYENLGYSKIKTSLVFHKIL